MRKWHICWRLANRIQHDRSFCPNFLKYVVNLSAVLFEFSQAKTPNLWLGGDHGWRQKSSDRDSNFRQGSENHLKILLLHVILPKFPQTWTQTVLRPKDRCFRRGCSFLGFLCCHYCRRQKNWLYQNWYFNSQSINFNERGIYVQFKYRWTFWKRLAID